MPTHQTNAMNIKSENEPRKSNVNVKRKRKSDVCAARLNSNITRKIAGEDMTIDTKMMKHIGVNILRMIIIEGLRGMGQNIQRINTMIDGMMIEVMATATRTRIAATIMGTEDTKTVIDLGNHHAAGIGEDLMIMMMVTAIRVVRMNSQRMIAELAMGTTTNRKMMIGIMDAEIQEEVTKAPMVMIAGLMIIMSRQDHVVAEEVIILDVKNECKCH